MQRVNLVFARITKVHAPTVRTLLAAKNGLGNCAWVNEIWLGCSHKAAATPAGAGWNERAQVHGHKEGHDCCRLVRTNESTPGPGACHSTPQNAQHERHPSASMCVDVCRQNLAMWHIENARARCAPPPPPMASKDVALCAHGPGELGTCFAAGVGCLWAARAPETTS